MNGLTYFLRMARWARHPPSSRQVKVMAAIVALCLGLYAIDRLVGWPDWLTPENTPRGRVTR